MGIPVILDTDIGLDVDDVWALAFLLRCPELDLKLVVSDTGDTRYSASVAAKLLEAGGRVDVPIGVGVAQEPLPRTHAAWLGDYELSDYPGEVFEDGVVALCDTILASPEPVTLICIGPIPNIAAALEREPAIVQNSRFIGMHGSLRRGYLGAPKPMREYNVFKHPLACRRVFETPWDLSITPLDSCGTVYLKDENFSKVRESRDPLMRAVLDNHFAWCDAVKDSPMLAQIDPQTQSSRLYDTVAVYMAFSESLLEMETLPILVTDDGKTLIDDKGQLVRCATGWKDQSAFERLLADRLV